MILSSPKFYNLSGQSFLFGSVDLAVTDSAGVKNVAVFGDGQTAHRLILFGEPVKKMVKFSFIRRLCVAYGKQRQCANNTLNLIRFV